MKIRFNTIATIIKTAYKAWISKDPFRESAAIAYYSIFSLPGLLVVILTIAGYFFGHDSVNNHVTAQITATLGVNTAQQIHDMILKASEAKNSVLATIIGLVTIIVGATGVFTEFQKSLNAIWEVKADKSKSGVRFDCFHCVYTCRVACIFCIAVGFRQLACGPFFRFIRFHAAVGQFHRVLDYSCRRICLYV
jgi:YihY family inner membrane protein